jgi:predicted lipoprotein with Yx(FWY)xxD motif
VSVKDVSGTSGVLVDSSGMTLYVSDQEMSGKKVLCSTDDCTAIWTPLTVGNGQKPSGPADVMGLLATVARPDGKSQVTLNGAPMYTFSFDHGAGDLKGDGQKDTFGGTSFTWHTATANGAAAPAPSTSSSSDSGGGGYGGY